MLKNLRQKAMTIISDTDASVDVRLQGICTLLKESVKTSDIANAAFVFVSGQLGKSTGNMLNVDGGLAAAFPR